MLIIWFKYTLLLSVLSNGSSIIAKGTDDNGRTVKVVWDDEVGYLSKGLLGELLCKETLDTFHGGTGGFAGELDESETPNNDNQSNNQNLEVCQNIVDTENTNRPENRPPEELLHGVHWFAFRLMFQGMVQLYHLWFKEFNFIRGFFFTKISV